MFTNTKAFSSFAVNDIEKAKAFYGGVLELKVEEGSMGVLYLQLGSGTRVLLYPKPSHKPAEYTILNFQVSNVEAAVDTLNKKGVIMEQYHMGDLDTDAKGIFRGGGPVIAWFTDPFGNILSVLEQPA